MAIENPNGGFKCEKCKAVYADLFYAVQCERTHPLTALPKPITHADIAQREQDILRAQEPIALPVAVEQAIVQIGEGFSAITKFLSGTTLPAVMESHALMTSLGQILSGLTTHGGRQGLDARTIKQDAIDGSYRILEAFSHLAKTLQERKSGERAEGVVDAEADYKKFKEENSKSE